ncbi:chorion peroxidase-like [Liolophura sinensis]|uniref:chorion peroxidase-like n=1 Tax=Liolophura sinensis TaxID=3198878 RepID=UPI003159093C
MGRKLSPIVLGLVTLLVIYAEVIFGQGDRGTPKPRRPPNSQGGAQSSGNKLTPIPTPSPTTTINPPQVPSLPGATFNFAGPEPHTRRSSPGARSSTVVPEALISGLSRADPFFTRAARGLPVDVSQDELAKLINRINNEVTKTAIVFGKQKAFSIANAANKGFSPPKVGGTTPRPFPFGPHLFTSKSAATIGRTADKFLAASEHLRDRLNLTTDQGKVLRAAPLTVIKEEFDCPFDDAVQCDISSKYRTFDGSCNNLVNPILGRANTPFERFLPSQYEDGIGALRVTGQGSKLPLPNARDVSANFHQISSEENLQSDVSLFTMIYGQHISHDVNMNTISRGENGIFLDCCGADGRVTSDPQLIELGCAAISISDNDPFFSQFNRKCLRFVRALGGTDLKCSLGSREQTNQVTHYLDGSGVYGSNDFIANDLRRFTGGLLKSAIAPDGRELLLQDPSLTGTFACRSAAGSNHHCFSAGDVRVNQNPSLAFIHTLLLREHNRVARALAAINPFWNDEKLFQETRRIVTAILQHVTYGEYLPVLISEALASGFGLLPQANGYFTGYSNRTNPAIRNGFVAAAYRCGHSNIDDFLAPGLALSPNFNNPTALYSPGIDNITHGLTGGRQQTMDRRDAETITNRLFEGASGTGTDLPAINIQRGRDHGLPSYNDYREFCGYPRAVRFSVRDGGLIHHTTDSVIRLSRLYESVDDIDAWTGMSSEKRIEGGVFGPTAACLVGLQFNFLKTGDRFFYENDVPETRFSLGQLDAIRKVTLSGLVCVNTGRQFITKNSFRTPSSENPTVHCSTIPTLDLSPWKASSCIDGGWSPWQAWGSCSQFGLSFRYRFCDNPVKNACGKDCEGLPWEYRECVFTGIANQGRKNGAPVNTNVQKLNATDPADQSKIFELAKSLAPDGVFPN